MQRSGGGTVSGEVNANRRRPLIPTVRRIEEMMQFRLRTLLTCVSMTAISSAFVAYTTRDYRNRIRIESDLVSMGASRVTFDEESRPKSVVFSKPLTSDRIAVYNPIDQFDLTGAHVTEESILNMRRLFLRGVNFEGSDISDRQLELLPNVRCISHLSLKNTDVSDQSITAISSIERLSYVDLTGTRITPSGAEKLRALVPGITVEH